MVSSIGEIRRLLESEPFNRHNGPTNGSPHPSQHHHVNPSDSSDPFATVVILLILGISFIIIITILICVKVCVIGMAGSDDEDDCLRLLLGELLSSLLLSTMSYMNPPYRPPNWGHPIYNNTLQEEFEWWSVKGVTMIFTCIVYAVLIGGSIFAITYLFVRVYCCGGPGASSNNRGQVADSAPVTRPLVLGLGTVVQEVRIPLAEPEIIVTPV
ncbi:hypothetical protein PRIPAC_97905 [Pristionchus pacificus]|uniref:Uncharacterized protein n=1 Tax=Pristionchus pacificus TaxID=54126 RepID=A0A2A6BD36_PRIPA|nr:hypothetical protein PRIPAC_97905 [Pristionchus pacificus]|eukprot:PDM63810.1 hypothetical protein PRIPAC_49783 [Pristionchus pacificus]